MEFKKNDKGELECPACGAVIPEAMKKAYTERFCPYCSYAEVFSEEVNKNIDYDEVDEDDDEYEVPVKKPVPVLKQPEITYKMCARGICARCSNFKYRMDELNKYDNAKARLVAEKNGFVIDNSEENKNKPQEMNVYAGWCFQSNSLIDTSRVVPTACVFFKQIKDKKGLGLFRR